MPNKTKNEKRKKEKYIVESVISSPTSASGEGSSSSQIFAIPDEDSVRLGPYPVRRRGFRLQVRPTPGRVDHVDA